MGIGIYGKVNDLFNSENKRVVSIDKSVKKLFLEFNPLDLKRTKIKFPRQEKVAHNMQEVKELQN